ncbi:MAG: acetylxylan esterase, partial [Planctomycetota bacterium]
AYLMDKVYEAVDRRKAEYESVETPEEIQAYQERMRQFFIEQLGGFPDRTPLNARVVGREQRDGYRIEQVIFESQPRHFVTAILYLPESEPPYPGVLVPCGHSANGKARDLYQRAPILIAKNGMAALCYDPLDQGERHQLLDADGEPIITRATQGHNLAGVGAILLGRNTATYRTWDGIRALDYLADREEVDPKRLGCTGISGGGTMTSYLMALDDRVEAAAPGCYLTSFQRLLETIGPQDAEQTIHAQIGYGMDHADYILMRAPQPTLMMTATDDYFDIEGAWNTFRQAKRWYTRRGFAARVDLIEVDSKHGFPAEMREAATRWMRRWLLHVDDAVVEHEFPIATDEELQCTPRGEVMLLDGARSVYDLNMELEARLAAERQRFWKETDHSQALAEVRDTCQIRSLEKLRAPDSEKVGSISRPGYSIEKMILRPEPGIALPALMFVPDQPAGPATLYVHAEGKQTEAAPGGKIEALAQEGRVVLAPDLRGIGETTPGGKHSYAGYLPVEWRDSTIAYLLGKPLLAMRAEDILVCARFLAEFETEGQPRSVDLHSVGHAGPPALHAAALEPNLFDKVVLQRSLISWSNVVHTPLSKNQSANLVHGALRIYDLPDLRDSLSDETLTLIEPLDAAERPVKSN